MFKRLMLVCTVTSCWATTSMAGPISLIADRGLQGSLRYCEYSNGQVYAVNPDQTCPANIKEPPSNGKGMGLLVGQSHEGSEKLCVYRVAGQEKTLRVGTNSGCPLNQEF